MSKDTMPKRGTGVYLRAESNVYQWRIKAPKDLWPLYPSGWACRTSLETSDIRQANAKAASLRDHWLTRFDQQRRAMNPQKLDSLTPEMGRVLASEVLRRVLEADERQRTNPAVIHRLVQGLKKLGELPEDVNVDPNGLEGVPEALAEWWAEVHRGVEKVAVDALVRGRAIGMLEYVQTLAGELGFCFDEKTPGIREVLHECLRATRVAASLVVKRDNGEVIPTPPAAVPVTSKATHAEPKTLRDVYTLWKATKRRSADSLRKCELALELFEQRTGNTPVKSITRAQGDDFRSWLQTLESSSKTAHDRLTWVKSLLVYAYRDLELIPRQPWEGIDIEHRTENKRRPWTAAELQTLLQGPIFTAYELPTAGMAGKDAAYWIPLLGLYTGSRVSELAQLTLKDIDTAADIPTLTITDEGEEQQLKTDASQRTIPIHSELIRLGFLEYVEDLRSRKDTELFPHLLKREGKPGGYFSAWFGKNKPAGLPDFHSFRHTVRSAMAEANVSESLMDRVTGHAVKGSVGTKVYQHVTMNQLRAAVETVKYSIALHRVYPSSN